MISDSHRGDRERNAALSEYFVNSVPGTSWITLAGALYYWGERKALRAVGKNLKEGKGVCGLCGNVVLLIVCVTYTCTCMYRYLNVCWRCFMCTLLSACTLVCNAVRGLQMFNS